MAAKKKDAQITFNVSGVRQIKTMLDGKINITLTLEAQETEKVFALLEMRNQGAKFEMSAVPVFAPPEESNAKKDKNNQGRTTRKRQRFPYRG